MTKVERQIRYVEVFLPWGDRDYQDPAERAIAAVYRRRSRFPPRQPVQQQHVGEQGVKRV